jgi:hypothetical protein
LLQVIHTFHCNKMNPMETINPNGTTTQIANAALTLVAQRMLDGDELDGILSYNARRAKLDDKLSRLYHRRHKNFERIIALSTRYTATHEARVLSTIENCQEHEEKLATCIEAYKFKRLHLAQELVANTILIDPRF